jgi:hypothetical protein
MGGSYGGTECLQRIFDRPENKLVAIFMRNAWPTPDWVLATDKDLNQKMVDYGLIYRLIQNSPIRQFNPLIQKRAGSRSRRSNLTVYQNLTIFH